MSKRREQETKKLMIGFGVILALLIVGIFLITPRQEPVAETTTTTETETTTTQVETETAEENTDEVSDTAQEEEVEEIEEVEEETEVTPPNELSSTNLQEIKEAYGFNEEELFAFAQAGASDKNRMITYKDKYKEIEVGEYSPETITNNNEDVGLVLFSRATCPACLDYFNSNEIDLVNQTSGVHLTAVDTRNGDYANPEIASKYTIKFVPSIVPVQPDGNLWYPSDESLERLNEAFSVSGTQLEQYPNEEGAIVTAFIGGLTGEDAALVRDLVIADMETME